MKNNLDEVYCDSFDCLIEERIDKISILLILKSPHPKN